MRVSGAVGIGNGRGHTNAQEEAVHNKCRNQSINASPSAISSRSKRGEENDDDGRCHKRPFSGVVVRRVAEKQHAHYRPSERDT